MKKNVMRNKEKIIKTVTKKENRINDTMIMTIFYFLQ